MKRLLLLLFILSSVSLYSQDWAPFKLNDSIRHFMSHHIPFGSTPSRPYPRQIQSVVENERYIDSVKTTLVFKKGYNKEHNNTNNRIQLIKGQVLGDSAFIYSDSTIFKSIDSYGFTLFFPHKYSLGSTFKLAKKLNGNYLNALVIAVYTDTINNNLDSLVKLQVSAYNNSNSVDTAGGFHNSEIVISKFNGLISGFDFTYLRRKIAIEQYFTNYQVITKNTDNQLSIGDEYHYTENNHNGVGLDRKWAMLMVIGDTTIGVTRAITYNVIEKKQINFVAPTFRVYNYLRTFNINDTVIVFESQIIQDSILNKNQSLYSVEQNEFLVCPNCNSFDLGYTFNNQYNLFYNFITQKTDQLIYTNSGLQTANGNYILGIDDYQLRTYHNGQTTGRSIVYIKHNNKTWGTPLNLTVGVNDLQIKNKFSIFPNPTTGIINLSEIENLNRVEVYNIQGQLIDTSTPLSMTTAEQKSHREQSDAILIKGKAGLYFVKLYLQNGQVETVKVIKQ